MRNGVAIRYGDIAPEAKENFSADVTETQPFVDFEKFKKYNLNFPNYVNPCDYYQTPLDGKGTVFPTAPETANLGWWSEQKTDENGLFANPITMTLTAEKTYTSQGITLHFDKYNNIFPSYIKVIWYRDFDILSEMEFYPDNAEYFCQNKVENYNKLKITFTGLNMPFAYLKVFAIDYGYGTFFYGDELRNVNISQAIDPVSGEISINYMDFELDSVRNIEYDFQKKQPLIGYFDGEMLQQTFITNAKRKSKRLWKIESEDYIGLMHSIPFFGGVYEDVPVKTLLDEIFTKANIPYVIDEGFLTETISGYIPYTTCREAVLQIAFALGAVVDTSKSEFVKIYALDDDIKQEIPLNRIMEGQTFTDEEKVTGVSLTAHNWVKSNDVVNIYGSKDEEVGVIGEEVFLNFSEPVYNIIVNGAEVIESSANHIKFRTTAKFLLIDAKKYKDQSKVVTKKDEFLTATEIENILPIEDAMLVNAKNVDKILDKCYNYLTRNKKVDMGIVEGKHVTEAKTIKYGEVKYGQAKYGETTLVEVTYDAPVNVGEKITFATEYYGNQTARIVEQKYNLDGGIKIKEAVLR
jgi:hypothetical protein